MWQRSRTAVVRSAGANSKEAARRAITLAASLTAAAALTLAIKRTVRRVRPGSGVGLYGSGADLYSFPSGHAMRMGVITVWAAGLSAPWRAAAALLALWVGISRVRLGIHYVGDVVGGYLLGAALATLLRKVVHPK